MPTEYINPTPQPAPRRSWLGTNLAAAGRGLYRGALGAIYGEGGGFHGRGASGSWTPPPGQDLTAATAATPEVEMQSWPEVREEYGRPIPAPRESMMETAPGVKFKGPLGGTSLDAARAGGGRSNFTSRLEAADVFDPESVTELAGIGTAAWRKSLDERYGTAEELAMDPNRSEMERIAGEVAVAEANQRLARARLSPEENADLIARANPTYGVYADTTARTDALIREKAYMIEQARRDPRFTTEEARQAAIDRIEQQYDETIRQFNPRVRESNNIFGG